MGERLKVSQGALIKSGASMNKVGKRRTVSVASFGEKHPVLYGLFVTGCIVVGLIVAGFLCAAHYAK